MKHWLFSLLLPCSTCAFSYELVEDGIYIERHVDPSKPGPRIAMLTAIIDEKPCSLRDIRKQLSYGSIVGFGTKSKEIYAKKYGYDLIICRKKLDSCYGIAANGPLEASWSKLPLLAKFIDEYDWVFWTDADSIILNFSIQLEDIIDDDYDILGCTQIATLKAPCHYCDEIKFVNAGQLFFKNSQVAKEVILGTWAANHPNSPWYEQTWFNNYIKENNLHDCIKVCPPSMFNSRGNEYCHGEFLAHMYGYRENLRQAFIDFENEYGHILDFEIAAMQNKEKK